MRYKIGASNATGFTELLKILRDKKIIPLMESKRRHFVAVEIEEPARQELVGLGFVVTSDQQMVMEK